MKLKQKRPKSTDVPPTTIRGDIQEVKDRYAGLMLKHTTGALDRMHTSGMPVKTETVKRGKYFLLDAMNLISVLMCLHKILAGCVKLSTES